MIDEKKQIDEMAHKLCGMNISCEACRLDKSCLARNSAEMLYNASYRKQNVGEWRVVDDGVSIGDGKHIECSVCGMWKKDRQRSNFCPNCGARMKGGEG